jgi:hypothetical protein
MAFANVLQEQTATDGTTFTTVGNLTPVANRLYLCSVFCTSGSTPPTAPTVSGGGMTTWTLVNSTTRTTSGLWVFRALQASPGAAAPLLIDGGAQTYTSFSVIVDERDTVDTGGSNGADAIAQSTASNAAAGTTYAVSFSGAATEAENEAWSAIAHVATEANTTDGTELGDVNGGTPGHSLITAWFPVNGQNTPQASWSTSTVRLGVVVEVDVASAVAPSNTVAPVVSGTKTQGQTLSCTTGTWDGSPTPTYTYQWQRDVLGDLNYGDIGSATASTYLLTSSDPGCNIRCVVTGTNASGSDSEPSQDYGLIGTGFTESGTAGLIICGSGTGTFTPPDPGNTARSYGAAAAVSLVLARRRRRHL